MSRMRAEEKAMNAKTAPETRAACRACTAALIILSLSASASADPAFLSMPDPAALYCEAIGYEHRIVNGPGGRRGVCVLPDGREVDAWDFYRGKAAPEYSYCAREGYGTATLTEDHGSYLTECAVCVAQNGKRIGTVAELMGLDLESARGLERTPAFEGTSAHERAPEPDRTHSSDVFSGAGRDPDPVDSGRHSRFVPRYVAVSFGGSPPNDVIPEKFDWRRLDGATAVKAQGNCGSCWAFSTVGALECNILIKDGVEVDLSEQWLVSCNQHNWGCGGGGFAHRYHMLTTDPCGDSGAVLENDFQYTASNAPCECPYPHHFHLDGWGYADPSVDIPDPELIKRAILEYGPISVGVMADAAFSNYRGGVFTGGISHDINHAVVLVGWDDNQGTDGIWYLRNSWGTMWGEQGYMRIERGRNAVGWGANWVDYRDPIEIFLDEGTPGVVEQGVAAEIAVRMEERTDDCMSGTAMLHYRFEEGGYTVVPLTPLSGGMYKAVLPPADCDDSPEFFFSAAGLRFGSVYSPRDPLSRPYTAEVGVRSEVFRDDFESDLGWTVENGVELSGGAWERGVPVGGGDRSDPPSDSDGSGSCYLTGNSDGDSDVDGGWTRLVSPVFDLSGAERAVVEFAYWYRNDHGDNPNGDYLIFLLSDDGGASWVTADAVGPRAPIPVGWKRMMVTVGDHIALTNSVRVAVEASDEAGGSLVEAGLDDFSVSVLSCGPGSEYVASDPAVVSEKRREDARPADDVIDGLSASGDRLSVRDGVALGPNFPNPFASSTAISFRLPEPNEVTIRILSPSGRVVRTLLDAEARGAGEHSVIWDGTDDSGERSASGVYFCRLEVGGQPLSGRLLLLN